MPFSLDPDRSKPPKELGGFIGLFDKPVYRDWLAWWTLGWAVISGLALAFPTAENASTSNFPKWLDVLLAVAFFTSLFGFLPAYARVLLRRWSRRRRRRNEPQADAPRPAADAFITAVPKAAPSTSGPGQPEHQGRPQEPKRQPPSPKQTPPQRPVDLHLIDAAGLQQNEVLSEARESLPYPVARAVRRLQLASDAKEAYEAALHAGEALTTVLGILASAWGAQAQVRTDSLDRVLQAIRGRGIAQGTWLEAAGAVEKPMVQLGTSLPGLLDTLKQGRGGASVLKDLKAVVEERNAWAHGASPRSKAEATQRLSELLPHLEAALRRASPLAQHEWLYIEGAEFQRRDNTFKVRAQRAMADHPDWDRSTFTSTRAVVSESFYVRSTAGLIDLNPFVVMRDCPTCRQPEMAYADRVDQRKGVALKSFDRGHPFFDPSLVPDVQALGNWPSASGGTG